MWRLSPPFSVAGLFYATSLILLRLRVLGLSQSAPSSGAAVESLRLEMPSSPSTPLIRLL